EIVAKSLSRSVSPVEDKNEEGKKKEEIPLTRSFQMEATFGALTEKKVEAKRIEETVKIEPPKIFESVADLPIKKVVAASIKINGLPVKMEEKPSEENEPEKEAVPAVRIRIRSGKSPTRV
uniref:Uncharacterized protein n=1 Tax=Caenorhabditis japonica TaxID=281687 RepID=A0A8R1EGI1_CAEJA